jgi:rod shape determining protein RodA
MIRERFRSLDPALLIPMMLLVFMGTLTLYSAGRGTPQPNLWLKQSLWNLCGLLLMAYVGNLSPSRIFRWSSTLYIIGILLLVAVLIPHVGKSIGGSRRWLALGVLTFQPSELMKWIALLFVAHRLGTKPSDMIRGPELVGTVGLVLFPMLLVFKQPDLGMAISFLPILVLIPLIWGLRAKWVALGLVAASLFGVFAWKKLLHTYQKQRVLTLLNPEADLQGKGYQINQSRIAIGAGGFLGQGFTSGSQTQLNFLPVKTTDFVFAAWAEERGFLGVLLALGLFGTVVSRILNTARQAKTEAEAYFCAGAASLFMLHIFVNVGMVAGVLPNKGIVLPFFSAGGSSTLSYFLGLGVVMAIHHRAKAR